MQDFYILRLKIHIGVKTVLRKNFWDGKKISRKIKQILSIFQSFLTHKQSYLWCGQEYVQEKPVVLPIERRVPEAAIVADFVGARGGHRHGDVGTDQC